MWTMRKIGACFLYVRLQISPYIKPDRRAMHQFGELRRA
jgi:hypothetical protein